MQTEKIKKRKIRLARGFPKLSIFALEVLRLLKDLFLPLGHSAQENTTSKEEERGECLSLSESS